MSKFHINNSFEVKQCKATLMPCRFTEHYTNEKEAYKAAEELILKENEEIATIYSLKKLTQKPRITRMLDKNNFQKLDPITQKTVIAGINRINPKLSAKEREYWQTIYDQSPAGKIALKRLQKTNPQKFKEKQEKIQQHKFDNAEIDFEKTEQSLSNVEQKEMILLSATWMSNLSPEEIDSIHWITTHGSGIINKYMRNEEHPSAHNYSKEFIAKQAQSFLSAMKKSPVINKPITIYRGTKEKNVIKDFSNSPASSSTDYKVAENFTKNKTNAIIMKISTRKIANVSTMSDWGIDESEILAPLGKYEQKETTKLHQYSVIELNYIDED